MSLFLASVRIDEGDLLLGACETPEQGNRLLAEYAASRVARDNACPCCQKIHPKNSTDAMRLQKLCHAMVESLVGSFRLERVY